MSTISTKRKDESPPEFITESEFHSHSTEWLELASKGRQILVVDDAQQQKIRMALGMGGVVFNVRFAKGKYGYDRTGDGCSCSWASRVHGDICPEHGTSALIVNNNTEATGRTA